MKLYLRMHSSKVAFLFCFLVCFCFCLFFNFLVFNFLKWLNRNQHSSRNNSLHTHTLLHLVKKVDYIFSLFKRLFIFFTGIIKVESLRDVLTKMLDYVTAVSEFEPQSSNFRSLSDKHPLEMYDLSNHPNYGLNSTISSTRMAPLWSNWNTPHKID